MSAPVSPQQLLLPKEHGSWSLAFEPLALGLLAAPSRAGLGLAAAVAAGFFLRRPLKLAATLPAADARRTAARGWVLLLAFAAAAGLGFVAVEGKFLQLWPLLLSVPPGALFLLLDLRHDQRAAAAELAGSTAFALLPAAFATLAGWPPAPAFALAAIMLARSIPTVLTVRAYLRLNKGEPARASPPLLAAASAAVLLAILAARGWVPMAAPALAALLLGRTVFLTTPLRPAWPARRIGVLEAALGVVYLAGIVLAYHAQAAH